MLKKILLFIFWVLVINNSLAQISFTWDTIFFFVTYCRRLSLSPNNHCWAIANKDSSAVYEIDNTDQTINRTAGVRSVSSAKYSDIVAMANNVSFVATPNDYLIKYDAGTYSKLGEAAGLHVNNINTLERVGINTSFITRQRPGLALGTARGLYMTYDNTTFSSYGNYTTIPNYNTCVVHYTNGVTINVNIFSRPSVCPIGGDSVFTDIAYSSGGIVELPNSSQQGYKEKDSINTFVDIMANYNFGQPMFAGKHIWGTKSGLYYRIFECYQDPFKYLVGNSVNKIYEMRYFPYEQYLGSPREVLKLLIGSDSGLFYDPMTWKGVDYTAKPDSIFLVQATKGYKINDIEVDGCNSYVWLATDKGIVRLKINYDSQNLVLKTRIEHPNNDKPICASNPVTLSASRSSFYSYQWQRDSIDIINTNTSDYTTGVPGDYRYIYTYSDGCRTYKDTSESVTIVLDTLLCTPPAFPDTVTVCKGGSYLISTDCSIPSNVYQWYRNGVVIPNARDNKYEANVGGYYKMKISNCNRSTFSDSIFINMPVFPEPVFPEPVITVLPNKTLCMGDTAKLSIPSGNYDVLWFKNSVEDFSVKNNNPYFITSDGAYSVRLEKDKCFVNSIPVQVKFNPISKVKIKANKNLPLCKGDEVILTANNKSASYKWSTGETDQSIGVKTAGLYKVVSYDANACKSEDSLDVKVVPIPVFSLGNDTTFCEGERIPIHLEIQGAYKTYFINGVSQVTNSFDVYTAGAYIVSVSDKNTCKNSDTLLVFNSCPDVFIPNLITPNGDNKNDFFVINGLLPESTLIIYNRWGNQVYLNMNYMNDWNADGLNDGVYYYELSNTYYFKTMKGWIDVVR